MNQPIHYQVRLQENGEQFTVQVDASDPGHAFQKAFKLHPNAKLLGCSRSSYVARTEFWINYEPPPVPRLAVKPPKGNETQTEMEL